MIQDVAVESLSVPLLRVELKSDLVLGTVTVGSDHPLPVMGVELILGNGLPGGIVSADLPTQSEVSEDAKIYPACAVTRTMTKAKEWRGISDLSPEGFKSLDDDPTVNSDAKEKSNQRPPFKSVGYLYKPPHRCS